MSTFSPERTCFWTDVGQADSDSRSKPDRSKDAYSAAAADDVYRTLSNTHQPPPDLIRVLLVLQRQRATATQQPHRDTSVGSCLRLIVVILDAPHRGTTMRLLAGPSPVLVVWAIPLEVRAHVKAVNDIVWSPAMRPARYCTRPLRGWRCRTHTPPGCRSIKKDKYRRCRDTFLGPPLV